MDEIRDSVGKIRTSSTDGAKKTKMPEHIKQAILLHIEILIQEIGCRVAMLEMQKKGKPATLREIRDIASVRIREEINSDKSILRYLRGAGKSKIDKIIESIGKFLVEEGFKYEKIKIEKLAEMEKPLQQLFDCIAPLEKMWMNEIGKILSEIEVSLEKPGQYKTGARKSTGKNRGKLAGFKEKVLGRKKSISYIRISKVTIPVEARKAILREISSIRDAIYAKAYFDHTPTDEIYGIVKTRLYNSINSPYSALFRLKNCTNAEKNKIVKYIADTLIGLLDSVRSFSVSKEKFVNLVTKRIKCFENINELLLNIDMKTRVPATGSKLRRARAVRSGVDFEKLFKARRAGKTLKVEVKVPKLPPRAKI